MPQSELDNLRSMAPLLLAGLVLSEAAAFAITLSVDEPAFA